MRKVVILSFLTSLLLGACGEDDYVYPNVLTDMIDLKTDHTGTGRYLITDEGTEWRIQSRTGLDGLAPDTTYRTVTMYAPLTDSEEAEKEAMLYNTQLVISPVPLSESKFKEIRTSFLSTPIPKADVATMMRTWSFINASWLAIFSSDSILPLKGNAL